MGFISRSWSDNQPLITSSPYTPRRENNEYEG
jgi:hypothetical protein